MNEKRKTTLLLLAIVALAAFFRFWQLDSIPPGLYPDEAMNGTDALAALRSGDFKIFYPNNNGREGLYINILAGFIKIFGAQIWVIRLLPAIIGTLTVIGIFLLAKELFGQKVGLWSSFFLATSFWHLNFSRVGFRAITVPFLVCFAFYFLFKGLRTLRWRDFFVGGLFFGAGFHTYIAFRFAPLILIIVLLAYWWEKQKTATSYQLPATSSSCGACYGVLIFLAATFIVAAPIGWYFLNNPQDFFGRTGQVSIFSQTNPLKELALSFGKTMTQYNFAGDYNWRHNFSGSPQLFWPVGIIFLIGIIISIKTSKSYKLTANSFLISGFLIMMLPSVLTSEGLPHALRTIGTIPFAILFAAIGAEYFFNWFNQKSRRFTVIVIVIVIVATTYFTFQQYFYRWAKNPEVEGSFTNYFVRIGQTLNSLPTQIAKYVIVNESGILVDNLPMPAQTPKFVAYYAKNVTYLNASETDQIDLKKGAVIIPMNPDMKLYETLQQRFGQLKGFYDQNGVFVIAMP